jgi:hypothetical protein
MSCIPRKKSGYNPRRYKHLSTDLAMMRTLMQTKRLVYQHFLEKRTST